MVEERGTASTDRHAARGRSWPWVGAAGDRSGSGAVRAGRRRAAGDGRSGGRGRRSGARRSSSLPALGRRRSVACDLAGERAVADRAPRPADAAAASSVEAVGAPPRTSGVAESDRRRRATAGSRCGPAARAVAAGGRPAARRRRARSRRHVGALDPQRGGHPAQLRRGRPLARWRRRWPGASRSCSVSSTNPVTLPTPSWTKTRTPVGVQALDQLAEPHRLHVEASAPARGSPARRRGSGSRRRWPTSTRAPPGGWSGSRAECGDERFEVAARTSACGTRSGTAAPGPAPAAGLEPLRATATDAGSGPHMIDLVRAVVVGDRRRPARPAMARSATSAPHPSGEEDQVGQLEVAVGQAVDEVVDRARRAPPRRRSWPVHSPRLWPAMTSGVTPSVAERRR